MGHNADEEMVLENIAEFIEDENKILTYKWLSVTLNLTVDNSKRLLDSYYSSNKDTVNATYLVGGWLKDDKKSLGYTLTKDCNLEKAKLKFDSITCSHIYSLQKCGLKDASLLYTADIELVKDSLNQLNACNTITRKQTKRSVQTYASPDAGVVQNVKSNGTAPAAAPIAKKEATKTTNNKKETPPLTFFGSRKPAKKPATKTEEKCDKKEDEKTVENSSKPKNAFSNFKSENTKSNVTENTSKNSEKDIHKVDSKSDKKSSEEVKETTPSKSDNADKQNAKKEAKEKTTNAEEEKKNETVEKEKRKEKVEKERQRKAVEKDDKSDEEMEVEKEIESRKSKDKSKKTEKKEKRKQQEEESEVENEASESEDDFEAFIAKSKDPSQGKSSEVKKKKRKKVEQEETNNEDDDVDVLAPTPEAQVKPKTKRRKKAEVIQKPGKVKLTDPSDESSARRRPRRRVLKSKQYVNDEGYMVTKKEYESESYSEEEFEVKKQPSVVEANKPKEPKKQQASLMSFFKKK